MFRRISYPYDSTLSVIGRRRFGFHLREDLSIRMIPRALLARYFGVARDLPDHRTVVCARSAPLTMGRERRSAIDNNGRIALTAVARRAKRIC